MRNMRSIVMSVVAVGFLVACGGGGSDSSDDSYEIDEYLEDLVNKSSLNIDVDGMSFYDSKNDLSYFYEEGKDVKIPIPNDEVTKYKTRFKKIDKDNYKGYYSFYSSGNWEEISETCEILSYKKVDSIEGVEVDAMKVEEKCTDTDGIEKGTNYIGVTKKQSEEIFNKKYPNALSIEKGFNEKWFNSRQYYFVSSKGVTQENGLLAGEYVSNGILNSDGLYLKIESVGINYVKTCVVDTASLISPCSGSYDKGYIAFDKNTADVIFNAL